MTAAAVASFDAVRGQVLRAVMRVPVARRVFPLLQVRVPFMGVVAVASAATLAAIAPLLMLWLSACLLGVPHVVSGVRHVVLRRRVGRLPIALAVVGVGVGAGQLFGLGDALAARGFIGLFALSAVAEMAPHRTAPARWLIVAVAGGAAAAWAFPLPSLLVLSHLHVLSSLAFVGQRAGQRRVAMWPMLALAGFIAVAAAAGAIDSVLGGPLLAPRSAIASISLEAVSSAFGHPSATVFRRALFLYAFGQSLHFSAWLNLVPALDRPAEVPQSLRVTLERFRRELGWFAWPGVVLCVIAAFAMLLGGGAAREVYFALTYAHLGLEGAAVLGAFVAGVPAPAEGAASTLTRSA